MDTVNSIIITNFNMNNNKLAQLQAEAIDENTPSCRLNKLVWNNRLTPLVCQNVNLFLARNPRLRNENRGMKARAELIGEFFDSEYIS